MPEFYPLSPAQMEIWLAQQLSPDVSNTIAEYVEIFGAIDSIVFQRSLRIAFGEVESVQVRFVDSGNGPIQRLVGISAWSPQFIDLTSELDPESVAQIWMQTDLIQPFKLEEEFPFRASLIEVSKQHYFFYYAAHHIAWDLRSAALFVRRVAQIYTGLTMGTPASDSTFLGLDVIRHDYEQYRESELFQRDKVFWKAYTTCFPGSPGRLGSQSSSERRTFRHSVHIAPSLVSSLRDYAEKSGISLSRLLIAATLAYLVRFTGEVDFVTGLVTASRSEATKNAVGLVANVVPLHLELSESPNFDQVVSWTAKHLQNLLPHCHFRGEDIKREFGLRGHSNLYSPTINAVGFDGNLDFAGNKGIYHNLLAGGGVDDLSIVFFDRRDGRGIRVDFYANGQLYSSEDLAIYARTLLTFLESVTSHPEEKICQIELLTAEVRQLLLDISNGTESEYPSELCIHQLFEQQAKQTADATALVFEDQSMSYSELNRQANQLAHYLDTLGVKPDDRVALCLERGFSMIVALLAILKAGAAYVPLDPAYPAERLHFMLDDAQPIALLTQNHLRSLFAESTIPVLDLDRDLHLWHSLPDNNLDPAQFGLTPQHLAYVIYTSGSTGTPKGVTMPHIALTNLLRWQSTQGVCSQRTLQFAALGFDVAFQEIFSTICGGGSLFLIREEERFDFAKLSRLIESHKIERVFLPFVALQALADELVDQTANHKIRVDISGLQDIITAGEQLRIDPKLESLFRLLPTLRLHNHYGPTETHVVTSFVMPASRGDWVALPPIGRPIANTRIYILDRYRQPVPIGVAGELYIGGAGVARGYLNRPELTAERFLQDPFVSDPHARMYKTGDLGRWLADGNIEFLGRNDDQVKIRGFRIELGEIEARLAQFPGIREAVVLAREDQPGDKRLVAYYTAERELASTAETLCSHLLAALPEYMVPAAYVRLQQLPLTPNGKLDRRALPAPDTDAFSSHGYEPPQGETEILLAQIWADLLNLERVGRQDNFFALGGHSLLAISLLSRVRRQLQVELRVNQIFSHPILSELATILHLSSPVSQPQISRVERFRAGGTFKLSFAQQRLWFLAQMEGVGQAYHIPGGFLLDGFLDRAALRAALDRILFRHEALRTTFALIDGEPVQRIAPAEEVRFLLMEEDLRLHSDPEAEQARICEIEASAPFDLEHGPLIRGRLLQLPDHKGEQRHALLVTMHHIVSDGWSLAIFNRELSTLYGAFQAGASDPLAPLTIQYPDYALWQRERIQDKLLEEQGSYWENALAGAPPLLDLPTDRSRPEQQDYRGASIPCTLFPELTSALRTFSQRQGTTLFMTLIAAWAALLARLANQQEVVVGTPSANRNQAEIEPLIGFFVNTLALRFDFSDSPSIATLLARVKTQAIAAQQHQDLPFEQVIELLNPPRSTAYNPLFQAMFVWQRNDRRLPVLPGLASQPLGDVPYHISKFDILFGLGDDGDRISGEIEYSTALFDASTIERIVGFYTSLLGAMVSVDDSTPIHSLQILPEEERKQVLYDWNRTEGPYPSHLCIHQLFEQQVQRAADATALVFEDQSMSYGDLNRQANRLAHYLHRLGVKPDDRVALCLERGFSMIVALLAVLKAGAAYLPLDPAYPVERLRFMLSDAQPIALLTQNHLYSLFAESALPVLDLDRDLHLWQSLPDKNLDPAQLGLTPQHLAYVIYTSGSTGTPKGVMVQHQGLVNRIIWMQSAYILLAQEAVLQKTPFSFDVSVWEFFWPLITGARLVVARPEGHKDPVYLLQEMQKNNITTLHFVPSMLQAFWAQLLASRQLPDRTNNSTQQLPSLRQIVCSGEALPAILVHQMQEILPTTAIHNLYGPTEATVDVTAWTCSSRTSSTSIPIGRPIANTRIYILDRYRQPVPIGVAGELYISGAGVARGYLNRPELTAERFLQDPFVSDPHARMYKTGDLGRWLADGNIEFLGRNDDQVKIRGFRIELGEIEARLAQFPGIREAVVLAREDQPGDKRLVAYSTAEQALEFTAETLRSHLLAALPEYMVPAAYVRLEQLPLTPNGKLDRRALPAPDTDAFSSRGYEPPQGKTEILLAQIWADLLNLERVGRHDNFFALGGHSLLAISLLSRIREAGLHCSVRTLFGSPTIAQLAATASAAKELIQVPENRIPVGCQSITPEMLTLIDLSQQQIDAIVTQVQGGAANIQDIYPLAPLQQGILFHHLLAEQGDPYILQILLGFDNRARLDAYLRALQWVIDRHDILRSAFFWQDLPEPVQVVFRQASLTVEELTLNPGDGEIAAQLQELRHPRHTRINLTHAPLCHAAIGHDLQQNRWLLLVRFHHIVDDNTSLKRMQEEIQAHMAGQEKRLAPPLPFKDIVAQSRLGISPQEHEAFFRQMLGDIEEPTALFGLLDVQGDGFNIAEATVDLNLGLARRLRQQARRLGVSAASLCHLAWALVLANTAGREDVVFGTVLFGRMQGVEGADRAFGMFINTLPLRFRIGEQGVEKVARYTHELLSQLLHHEHASLALAQRCSAILPPIPLFTTLLNYRHNSADREAVSSNTQVTGTGIEQIAAEERTNYPIGLSIDDLGEGFRLTAQTVASIDPYRICSFMQTALLRLTEVLETAPSTTIRSIQILPEEERKQVLYGWNRTEAPYPSRLCIHQLFEQQAVQNPDATALVFEDQSMSYGELNRQANQLAHYLHRLGVKPDDRVALCLERGFSMIVALLATLKAGAAYLPLDPAYPIERLRFMVADAQPIALITQNHLRSLFAESPIPVLDLDRDLHFWQSLPELNLDPVRLGLTPQHLAYVIYTSGSTGTPKGVMVQHQSLANLIPAQIREFAVTAQSAVSQFISFSFDACSSEVLTSLCAGASLYLAPNLGKLSAERIIQLIRDKQLTHIAVPSAVLAILPSNDKLLSLQTIVAGGDVLQDKLVQRWASGRQLINIYGPTEATISASLYRCDPTASGNPPIGRPIANTQIYILDRYQQPVPIGVAGELYIGGAGVARGYLNRPELTAERFLQDPFVSDPHARMYKTGDLGRWLADGNIEFLGRNDDQVKIRGFRIELGEIEARLAQFPGIREAVVLAREDQPGDKRLVAYYTAEQELEPTAEALRSHLLAALPEYMVPAAYVRLEQLQLTPNGKLDRRALPAPDTDAFSSRGYEPPQGGTEILLAHIWTDLLNLERVGRQDSFFTLGGHSLLAISLLSRIRKELQIDVSLNSLLRHATISQLAQHMNTGITGGDSDHPICVRSGSSNINLFLAHDGYGEILYATVLAKSLDPALSIYSLPAPHNNLLSVSVEAMAGRMITLMRSVQPYGPYRIAGWSFGGSLAYQIAAQLLRDGEKVAFLGLLDSYYLHGISENVHPQQQASENSEKRAIYHEAAIRYIAPTLDIPFYLFAAKEAAVDEPMRGWDKIMPTSLIRLVSVNGNHSSMFAIENLVTIGEVLSDAILSTTPRNELPLTSAE
jgi:amino acid adenylation domain-containing protein